MRDYRKLLIRLILLTHLFPALLSFTFFFSNQRHSITPNTAPSIAVYSPVKDEIWRVPNLHVLFISSKDKYVEAENLSAIQTLFSQYCDKEGLMTRDQLEKVPPFAEMLVSNPDGTLLPEVLANEELNIQL
eukprot:scaffold2830_cov131-Cylindrotheca_fusiformis.AAC.65